MTSFRPSTGLGVWLALGVATGAYAQTAEETQPPDPARPFAFGQALYAGPGEPGSFRYTLGAGYGSSGDLLGSNDSHTRLFGRASLEWRVLAGLGVGVRFDGRRDSHSVPGMPDDDGLTGDPRVQLRYDHAFDGGALRAGVLASLWLPGENAPSITPAAITPELLGALTWSQGSRGLSVTGNLGFRLDRSAKAAPDANRLSPSDRLALGVSDSSAVLTGVGVVYGFGRVAVHGEATWDVLIGDKAPPLGQSPLRAGLGARIGVARALAFEVFGDARLSEAPSAAVTAPLAPVLPGWTIGLGLSGVFGGERPAAPPPPPDDDREKLPPPDEPKPPEPKPEEPKPEEPVQVEPARNLPPGQLRGTVRSSHGRRLDGVIRIAPGDKVVPVRKGEFRVDLAPGSYEVTVKSDEFVPQTRTIKIDENGVTVINFDLARGGKGKR